MPKIRGADIIRGRKLLEGIRYLDPFVLYNCLLFSLANGKVAFLLEKTRAKKERGKCIIVKAMLGLIGMSDHLFL